MIHDEAERAARKRLLLARSAVLRLSLSQQLHQGLQPAWRTLDRADQGWRWLRAHPWVWAGAAAVLLVWRPKAAPAVASRAWGVWRWWRRMSPVAMPVLLKLLKALPATPVSQTGDRTTKE